MVKTIEIIEKMIFNFIISKQYRNDKNREENMKIKDIKKENWKLQLDDDLLTLEAIEKLPSRLKQQIYNFNIVETITLEGTTYYKVVEENTVSNIVEIEDEDEEDLKFESLEEFEEYKKGLNEVISKMSKNNKKKKKPLLLRLLLNLLIVVYKGFMKFLSIPFIILGYLATIAGTLISIVFWFMGVSVFLMILSVWLGWMDLGTDYSTLGGQIQGIILSCLCCGIGMLFSSAPDLIWLAAGFIDGLGEAVDFV